jgi:hypothetical protein
MEEKEKISVISLDSQKLTNSEVVYKVKKDLMVEELNKKKLEELSVLEAQYEASRSALIKKYEDYEASL